MSKRFQTAVWLIRLWVAAAVMCWSAAALGGYLGWLTVMKLTGQ
ncbi:hypothetical protein [Neisseria musculi]|uniref:Membrane protein n=1 Tax=Neisseria musculi TaxID=1815583 RepID=A0A7H1MBI8_9NEIS|nr:hypothetical protein [Neisseria musculi]QNT59003.1 putative membrane protein [Neisseria musculi]